ncbi:hypothetical protein GCM10010981_22380 [Dyella nitratireducens]|uniref:Uncharacterized protein n=2 Tax=Dyella nitratireducens TaxID=1849580 RepID=A0ABQ1FY56_9GAMM|nr:hypothetical protein GCM10010981_22380 [Dyella nitratireducens]
MGNTSVYNINGSYDAHFGKEAKFWRDGNLTTVSGNGPYNVSIGNKQYVGNGPYYFTYGPPVPDGSSRTVVTSIK